VGRLAFRVGIETLAGMAGSCWTRGRLVGQLVPGDTVHGILAEHSERLFPDEMSPICSGRAGAGPRFPPM
jgi:hypothetical protein